MAKTNPTEDAQGKTMSEEHRKALVLGKAQATIVRDYLEALARANKPKTGRLSAEKLKTKLADVTKQIETETDPLKRLSLFKDQRNYGDQLIERQAETMPPELEQAFIDVASDYAERLGYQYSDFRELGVPAAVLRDAGFTMTHSPHDVDELLDVSTNGDTPSVHRTRYSEAAKRKAVQMVRLRESSATSHWAAVRSVAAELGGPAPETVHGWWKQAEAAKQ